MHLEDVDTDTGPLHFLPANLSDELRSRLSYRISRLLDDQVFPIVGKDSFITCTGKKGTMIFVDSSRCFHFGSRPSAKPRKLLMIQYLSPFATSFAIEKKQLNTKHIALANDSSSMRDQLLFGFRR